MPPVQTHIALYWWARWSDTQISQAPAPGTVPCQHCDFPSHSPLPSHQTCSKQLAERWLWVSGLLWPVSSAPSLREATSSYLRVCLRLRHPCNPALGRQEQVGFFVCVWFLVQPELNSENPVSMGGRRDLKKKRLYLCQVCSFNCFYFNFFFFFFNENPSLSLGA